jgi:hypothetical protein
LDPLFQPHCGQAFQPLVLRIDLDANRLERRNTQARLCIVVAENERRARAV